MPSYSPVFSAAFIEYTAEAPNTEFEVPAGFTAVVRYASTFQEVGTYEWFLSIQSSLAAPTLTIYSNTEVGAFVTDKWEGRVVVSEGGIISVASTDYGSSLCIYVGGYLLRNNLA